MSTKTYALRVERTIAAPRAALFRAWTTPDLLKQWLHPSDEWSTPVAELDLRVGGAYRWGIRGPDGGTFYEVGEFREIRPPERLVYTCRYEDDDVDFDMPHEEMIVRVEFEQLEGGTRVVVVQEGYLRAQDRDAQQNGWPSFLELLAKLAESRLAASARAPGESLAEMLRVERRGPGEYRASLESFWGASTRGDLLARMTLAAVQEVGRAPSSLHASFLAPALPDAPLSIRCEAAQGPLRRVRAEQGGTELCEALLRFDAPEGQLSYQGTPLAPATPAPETLSSEAELGAREGWAEYAVGPVETRRVGSHDPVPDGKPCVWTGWLAPRKPLPDDAALQAAALVFLSEYRSHWAVERRLGAAFSPAKLVLRDHALWIHRTARWDDFWLVTTRSDVAVAGRCLSQREIRTRRGELVASASWELALAPDRTAG